MINNLIMKKIYFILLNLIPAAILAQTITQADLPGAGIAFTTASDTSYTASVPAGGMGQTWNYSALMNHQVDTTGFIASAGTPFAASFPSSNLAAYDASSGTYAYFNSNASGFYVDGVAASGFMLNYIPPDLFVPVPFSFGDTQSNMSRWSIDTSYTDSTGTHDFRIVQRTEAFFEADGTGSLTTPTSTYNNVLRVKKTQLVYDSLYSIILGFPVGVLGSASQTTDYLFLTTGLTVNYLMTLYADSLGTMAYGGEYLLNSVNLGINQFENKRIAIFPNPASSSIEFGVNGPYDVAVFDAFGKEVIHESRDTNRLNIASLSQGIYYFRLVQGNKTFTGSFVKDSF